MPKLKRSSGPVQRDYDSARLLGGGRTGLLSPWAEQGSEGAQLRFEALATPMFGTTVRLLHFHPAVDLWIWLIQCPRITGETSMLAAVPREEDRSLSLFLLALKIKQLGEGTVPAELKVYFDEVLNCAKSLSAGRVAVEKTDPAAMQLAIDMLQREELRREIESIADIDHVDAAIANRVLSSMEARVESAY